MRVKIEQRGIYETLVSQLDRIARHNRQGSYHTKRRYYEAEKRFCAYLADEYHLQKLSNVSGKHLVSYVIHMQDTGKSASTIKTDLAAIRFFHGLGGHLTKSSVYRAYKDIVKSIGRPDARFHDLRHSYAVAAIRSGDDIKTVQSNLGHATAAFTLDVYGHVTDKMKQESASRMETFIKSVSGG